MMQNEIKSLETNYSMEYAQPLKTRVEAFLETLG